MGAPKKADWREERRKRAWKLKEQHWKQQDIAKALGVSTDYLLRLSDERTTQQTKEETPELLAAAVA